MVVDDVQEDREAMGVTGFDEFLEPLRAAVGLMRGEESNSVITPAVLP